MPPFTLIVCKETHNGVSQSSCLCHSILEMVFILAYFREGCLETHIMSHIPTSHDSLKHLNSSMKDLNESTIILNCDKRCHISIDGVKSVYDKYEVFSFKLNKD